MSRAFSWNNLNYPIVSCPPMDGITDMAYRELIAEMGGSSVLYCEFVNVKGILYANPKTLFELRFTPRQRPIVAQLFGSEPDDFYEAAKVIVKMGFDAIDINMGCPSHKVAAKGGGCALMEDTAKARRIVEMTIKGAEEQLAKSKEQRIKSRDCRGAVHAPFGNSKYQITNSQNHPRPSNIPLTPFKGGIPSRTAAEPVNALTREHVNMIQHFSISVKMRLGVSDKNKVLEHGIAMIEAGAQAVAVHGRTLKQMYSGEADWSMVKKFNEIVKNNYSFQAQNCPKIFGSGDVQSLYDAFVRLITTGVDGVMIGRGSFGNPWVFDKSKVDRLREMANKYGWPEIVESIEKIPAKELEEIKEALSNYKPSFEELKNMAIHHAELMVEGKGPKGIIQMRKHLGWYFTGFEGAKELRARLVRIEDLEELREMLNRV